LIVDLATSVLYDIKAKSMPYRRDAWVSMPEQLTKESQMLSITAGEMFQLLASHLHNLEKELSTNLLGMTLRLVAEYLDEFFIDSMIRITKFSKGGTEQFNYDVTRNLFPLFGQYTRKPVQLFKK
jgi:RAD50-interacting protein 1